MTTIPHFFLGVFLTFILLTFYILIVIFIRTLGKDVKRIFKTLFFIVQHVRIVPCFAKGVFTGKTYKNSITDKNKKYVIILKIRVHYTLKYIIYNCQTQKLYMI